jgi:hypothetical protein
MSCFGDFKPAVAANPGATGDVAKRMFVVAGHDTLSVNESSVSSEWTTDSEDDVKAPSLFDNTAPPKDGSVKAKAKKKRVKKWRVKHCLAKRRHLCDASNSGRSSSSSAGTDDTSSTSSASDSAQDETVPKSERRQTRNDRRMASAPQWLEVKKDNPHDILQWIHGSKPHRHIAIAHNFLSAEDIEEVHRAAKHSSVKEIHDRKAYLAFKHHVVRFEMQLRCLNPKLYWRLMDLVRKADSEVWRRLRKKKNRVYPEVEYIEYDVKREQGECYIEPHVDNKAGVTLIAMLSPSSDYVGGNNCFRRGSGNEGHRQTRLEQGDVVMFRGEKLLHWITNVTEGHRIILQIELSRS